MFPTPIVYVFFNRPELTAITFARIREQRPGRLHLIADGARAGHPTDTERCAAARQIVEGTIDWPCTVTRDFSETNLGCGRRVSSGLTRAFAELGEAIVLEDDVLAHADFFGFCATLLARHRDDPRIHTINGFTPLGEYTPSRGAAVASAFNCIWGWASWQRAWKDYRFEIPEWRDDAVKERIRRHVASPLTFDHHAHHFDTLLREHTDTWDFQWSFAMLRHERLALISAVNFIENLGFDGSATHTKAAELFLWNLRAHSAVPTRRERPTASSDLLHDRLYAAALMAATTERIARFRRIARSPALLALFRTGLVLKSPTTGGRGF